MSTQHSILRAARRTRAWALASFALTMWSMSPVAQAADWVAIAKSDRTEVFANPATLGVSPASWVIVRTKQNFVEPQPSAKKGKSFLSARNEYRVDCAQRRLAYREMATYSQLDLQGDSVQKTRIGEKNLKWMDAPTGTVFGEIVDYACKNVPAGLPPATK
ncbi:MAG: surface-adhesin E family protein [Steroidobacteraceae bacterium]